MFWSGFSFVGVGSLIDEHSAVSLGLIVTVLGATWWLSGKQQATVDSLERIKDGLTSLGLGLDKSNKKEDEMEVTINNIRIQAQVAKEVAVISARTAAEMQARIMEHLPNKKTNE